jgi:hypothetical protein
MNKGSLLLHQTIRMMKKGETILCCYPEKQVRIKIEKIIPKKLQGLNSSKPDIMFIDEVQY